MEKGKTPLPFSSRAASGSVDLEPLLCSTSHKKKGLDTPGHAALIWWGDTCPVSWYLSRPCGWQEHPGSSFHTPHSQEQTTHTQGRQHEMYSSQLKRIPNSAPPEHPSKHAHGSCSITRKMGLEVRVSRAAHRGSYQILLMQNILVVRAPPSQGPKPSTWFVVQSLSRDGLCDPMDLACQAPLSFTIFRSLLRLICIESVMSSNHLILCCPLFLLHQGFFQWVSYSH